MIDIEFPSEIERTYVILKPDAWHRNLIGQIISDIEEASFKIIGIKMFKYTTDLFNKYFNYLLSSEYYQEVKKYLQSGPCVIIVVEGIGAVQRMELLCGQSYGRSDFCDVQSIRGRLSPWAVCNVVHRPTVEEKDRIQEEISWYISEKELFPDEHIADIYTQKYFL